MGPEELVGVPPPPLPEAPEAGIDTEIHEASSSATSPARLRKLARNRKRSVRRAVAVNPNADTEVLASLALRFPEAVLSNAALGWWVIEDPNWLASFPTRSRHRLLSTPGGPEGLRWWAARFGSSDDHRALLSAADVPEALLRYLRVSGDEEIATLCAAHVRADGATASAENPSGTLISAEGDEALDVLASCAVREEVLARLDLASVDVRRLVAGLQGAPQSVLLQLLLDDDERCVAIARANASVDPVTRHLADRVLTGASDLTANELVAVAESPVGLRHAVVHPSFPKGHLATLSRSDQWRVRAAAATSTQLDTDTIRLLAADDDRDVRAAIAANPTVPASLLRLLRLDADDLVRAAVERNPFAEVLTEADDVSLRPRELRRLVGDDPSRVARMPGLPLDVQRRLATSDDWRVRHALVQNPAVAPSVLSTLTDDDDLDVRRAVVGHDRTPRMAILQLCSDSVSEIRAAAASRCANRVELERLVTDFDTEVRRRLTENPRAGSRLLAVLAADADARVRVAVATRPTLAPKLVARLASDPSEDVRTAVVLHHTGQPGLLATAVQASCPDDVDAAREIALAVEQVLQQHFEVSESTVEKLHSLAPWVASLLVAVPLLPARLQVLLAASPRWQLRVALARRTDADPAMLTALSEDADFDTRAAVAANNRTPAGVREALARDPHRTVRLAIARSEGLTSDLAGLLSIDDDDEVRRAIAQHEIPHRHTDVLRSLSNGSSIDADELASLLSAPFVAREAATHPSVTTAHLDVLSASSQWQTRECVAGNPRTPAATLDRLADDDDRDVRRAVAGNPTTRRATVDRLRLDSDSTVARTALHHGSVDDVRRARRNTALRRALLSDALGARVLALGTDEVTAQDLARNRHAGSIHWQERAAVAAHPRTPARIRTLLLNDGHRAVVAAAPSPGNQRDG